MRTREAALIGSERVARKADGWTGHAYAWHVCWNVCNGSKADIRRLHDFAVLQLPSCGPDSPLALLRLAPKADKVDTPPMPAARARAASLRLSGFLACTRALGSKLSKFPRSAASLRT